VEKDLAKQKTTTSKERKKILRWKTLHASDDSDSETGSPNHPRSPSPTAPIPFPSSGRSIAGTTTSQEEKNKMSTQHTQLHMM
jgi:hypothetical protein